MGEFGNESRGIELTPEPLERASLEGVEKVEATERQVLEEATSQPEAVVERAGEFQQSESIEKIVSEMVTQSPEVAPVAEVVEVKPPEEAFSAITVEQKEIYDSFAQEDKEALNRMITKSQQINPGALKGHSGGLIY